MMSSSIFSPEDLAYWYFRLNGFFAIPNFVVHPDTGSGQRTDVDIMGVRFPYRKELLTNPMEDDRVLTEVKDKPYIIIAEVKTDSCRLNGPWTEPTKKNMHRVIRAIGAFNTTSSKDLNIIANKLYEDGFYEDEYYYLSLLCVGSRINPDLKKEKPAVKQILFNNILEFIYNRFSEYYGQKLRHDQWDKSGKKLWDIFNRNTQELAKFTHEAKLIFKLPIR